MVFLKVWGKVCIFLKSPECIFPEGPKALQEIYSLRRLKENIDLFAPNLKKDTVYSWKNITIFGLFCAIRSKSRSTLIEFICGRSPQKCQAKSVYLLVATSQPRNIYTLIKCSFGV